MKPAFRRATRDDAGRLFELRRESILQLAPRGMSVEQAQTWAAKMTMAGMEKRIQETEIWVAELDGPIVGWVSIADDYLDGLYTDPKFEKLGIGTALLGLAENLMRERGIQTVRADASWNAEEYYLRRGYEPTGPRPTDGARPLVKRLVP